MNQKDINAFIKICEERLRAKGDGVGISFYVFFKNKNDNPKLLFTVAKWWILKNQFDHFEKAIKIKKALLKELK